MTITLCPRKFQMSTTEDSGGSLWTWLRSSLGHAYDEDDGDDISTVRVI